MKYTQTTERGHDYIVLMCKSCSIVVPVQLWSVLYFVSAKIHSFHMHQMIKEIICFIWNVILFQNNNVSLAAACLHTDEAENISYKRRCCCNCIEYRPVLLPDSQTICIMSDRSTNPRRIFSSVLYPIANPPPSSSPLAALSRAHLPWLASGGIPSF